MRNHMCPLARALRFLLAVVGLHVTRSRVLGVRNGSKIWPLSTAFVLRPGLAVDTLPDGARCRRGASWRGIIGGGWLVNRQIRGCNRASSRGTYRDQALPGRSMWSLGSTLAHWIALWWRRPPMRGRCSRTLSLAGVTTVAMVAMGTGTLSSQVPNQLQDADFPEVYRVGGMGSPDWALFSFPGPVAFDATGSLYVLDMVGRQVTVVDKSGRLVRLVGRGGDGPGEFLQPMDLVVWRDGSLAVADAGRGIFQVFGADGSARRTVNMNPRAMLASMATAIRPDPRGNALLRQGASAVAGRLVDRLNRLLGDENAHSEAIDDRGIERVTFSGEVVTVQPVLRGWRPGERESGELSATDTSDEPLGSTFLAGQLASAIVHFEPQLHWDVLPDGVIAYADSSAYAVKLVDLHGSVTGVLRRPRAPEVVNRRVRSRTIEMELRRFEEEVELLREGGRVPDRRRIEAMRDAIEGREFFPEVPIIRGIRATWEGSLWIQTVGESPWDDDGPIDVFDSELRYIGTLPAPAATMPGAFGPDGLVAFWVLDEMDVPSIVVKRLPEALR